MATTRGVVLAGGKGTRLGELTKVTNKHLLPVGPFPMVYYPLKKLIGADIRDILLVSGTELEKRRREMHERIPPNQTPWQEIFRAMTDQLSEGMVLKHAVKYRDIAHKFVPRDSH